MAEKLNTYNNNRLLNTFVDALFILNLLSQPLMLIVPDVQDVYTPLQADVIVQLSEVIFCFYWFLFCIVALFAII